MEDLGVRQDLLLTRAVEQTALLLSLYAGCEEDQIYRPTVEEMAQCFQLGYLAHSYVRGRVVHRDTRDQTNKAKKELWRQFFVDAEAGTFGRAAERTDAAFDLDVVVSPVDGARALAKGRNSGSISLIAGGPRGSFPLAEKNHAKHSHFLLFTLGPQLVSRGGVTSKDFQRRRGESLTGFISRLLEHLGKSVIKKPLPSLATNYNDPSYSIREVVPLLRLHGRTHASVGSSVAPAIAAFYRPLAIDAYVGLARWTQVVLVAVAAQARGGGVIAIPLEETEPHQFELHPDHRVYRREHFVKADHDVFLVATSVTENQVLQGPRFQGPLLISTNSLCVRSRTRSSRFITTHHDLAQKRFRLVVPDDKRAEFLANLAARGIKLNVEYLRPA